jgi:hypothetical protein
MQGPSKKWQQPCVVEEERTSPQKGLKEDVVVVPPTHQIKITNGRLCVCVWESAWWGLASWFSNWRLKWPFIFPYSISAGFFERSVTFLAKLFFFLPNFVICSWRKGCWTIYLLLSHPGNEISLCMGFVCTRALTAMFALSVLTPNPLCKCPETRLSSSPSRLSLMETRSFHGDRESVTVNSPALSRADQINTGPRNRPMRMWMKNTNKKTTTKKPVRSASSRLMIYEETRDRDVNKWLDYINIYKYTYYMLYSLASHSTLTLHVNELLCGFYAGLHQG